MSDFPDDSHGWTDTPRARDAAERFAAQHPSRQPQHAGQQDAGRPQTGAEAQPRSHGKKRLPKVKPSKLRIIGGEMRGRGVLYLGDRDTRPMKESLREALFNIVGPAIKGRIAWDLFSGTGILAIESYSRGARGAVAIEKGRLFARTIRQSAQRLGLEADRVEVLTGDAFRLAPRRMTEILAAGETSPWVVFFCPPYALWSQQTAQLFSLLTTTAALAPPGSLLVTETDKFFDIESLPLGPWDVRPKGNMTLAFLEVTEDSQATPGGR